MKLNDAHICGNLECSTISNCDDICPGCTSKTEPVTTVIHHPIAALAHEIAEESAKSDLESFCVWLQTHDGLLSTRWYNITTKVEDAKRGWIDRAVQYLQARGILIVTHGTRP